MTSYKDRRNNTFKFIKTFLNYIQTATNNTERAQAVQQFKQQFQDLNYEVMQAEQDQSVTLQDSASDFKWVLEFIGALHTNSLKWEITLKRVNDFKNMVNTIQSGGNAKFMSLYNNPQTSDQWKEWMRYLYKDVIDHEIASKAVMEDEKARSDAGVNIVLQALQQWDRTGEAYNIVRNAVKDYDDTQIKIYLTYRDDLIKIVNYSTAVDMKLNSKDTRKSMYLSFQFQPDADKYVAYAGKLKRLFQMQGGQAQYIQKITKYSNYISEVKVYKRKDSESSGQVLDFNSGWILDDSLTNIIGKLIQLLGNQLNPDKAKNFSMYLIQQIANGTIQLDMNTYRFVLDSARNMIKDDSYTWKCNIQTKKQWLAAFGKREEKAYSRVVDDSSLVIGTNENGVKTKKQDPLSDVKFIAYALELALNNYCLYQYEQPKDSAFKQFGIFGKLFTTEDNRNKTDTTSDIIVSVDYDKTQVNMSSLQVNDLLQYQEVNKKSGQLLDCMLGKNSKTLLVIKPQEITEIKRNPRYVDSIQSEFKGTQQRFVELFKNLGTESPVRCLFGKRGDSGTSILDGWNIPRKAQSIKSPDVSEDMRI